MDTGRWQVEQLYHAALEQAPEMRTAFLDGACRQDSGLRREVESLLAQAEKAGSFLERRALEIPALEETVTMTARDTLPGSRFGAYRILSPLGAGGMGEVFRAHDSKLGRDVAIKTLPRAFASDPDRLARFRREARMLAALNHPNIAAIYGLEKSGEADCLVLELVEGETLRGPLPVDKALDYARQLAEALDAAHKKGIIHRDLKPANVKVTPEGRIKVLDFGLAKAIWGTDYAPDLSQMPTATGVASLAGHIVGTPGYMSPEQARGTAVDERTDIWAFGCLLYELLAGKRAFLGDTARDTIAAVLEREPDWQALPAATPTRIRVLLRRCLEKDASRRLPDIVDARAIVDPARRAWTRGQLAAIALAILAVIIGVALSLRRPARRADRSEWVQLTKFPDSVSQPALSPDGRMLTFVRGPGTFYTPGQVYIKMLPDGEPKPLTHDHYEKMSPVFSPDGSRIAYTTVGEQFEWGTWLVPVLGGESQQWLPNASGLVWIGKQRVLFSELRMGIHMMLMTAEESRAGAHRVYDPAAAAGMVHRSYASPDGKWALVVEMAGPWLPCRLVPLDGSSAGRRVGPPGGACTFAAWSPDGKWMYFSSSAGGAFHTWRQRFPDGTPEQITSGPTEEEGIAIAADGSSFITAVGQLQRPVTLHEAGLEREISTEGYAFQPKFAPNGRTLCYRLLKGSQPASDPTELWVADMDSGRNEPLLPGFSLVGPVVYDISPDRGEVAVAARDREGKDRLWLAALDRHSPPRQIANLEGTSPVFGRRGEIFFRSADGYVYRVREDGTALQKLLDKPCNWVTSISPDGKWLSVHAGDLFAYALEGGSLVRIGGDIKVQWSPDGRYLFISMAKSGLGMGAVGKAYVIPIPPGQTLPHIPAAGFLSEAEIAKLPGVRVIEASDIAPGLTPDVYAFSRETTQRNLYRIPVP